MNLKKIMRDAVASIPEAMKKRSDSDLDKLIAKNVPIGAQYNIMRTLQKCAIEEKTRRNTESSP